MKKLCTLHGLVFVQDKKDRCPECVKQSNKTYDNNSRSQESNKVYQSKRWKEVRLKALLRDSYQCVECNKIIGIKPRDHVVDHVVEIKDGGERFDIDNLQTLCQHCHNIKTNLYRGRGI